MAKKMVEMSELVREPAAFIKAESLSLSKIGELRVTVPDKRTIDELANKGSAIDTHSEIIVDGRLEKAAYVMVQAPAGSYEAEVLAKIGNRAWSHWKPNSFYDRIGVEEVNKPNLIQRLKSKLNQTELPPPTYSAMIGDKAITFQYELI